MNKFLVYFLMMFLLILVGGEVYACSCEDPHYPYCDISLLNCPTPAQPASAEPEPELVVNEGQQPPAVPPPRPSTGEPEAAAGTPPAQPEAPAPATPPQNPQREQLERDIADVTRDLSRISNQISQSTNQTQIAQLRAEQFELQQDLQELVNRGLQTGDLTEDQLRIILTQTPDLTHQQRLDLIRQLEGQSSCDPESWFRFICNLFSENRAAQISADRFSTQLSQNTQNAQTAQEHNEIALHTANSDFQGLLPGFGGCQSLDSTCRQQIANFDCQGNENCERGKREANAVLTRAQDSQMVPNSGMIRAAQLLRITPQASATSSMIQNMLGIELSLIQKGSGIDQILSYGTPEQICLAKVDSFISVNGIQVEGQVMEVRDEITGMGSVLRACDNMNFQICADLRAERSGIYFNNSFTLFTHVFVRNAEDFHQMVTLHAELKSPNGGEERINIVEQSQDLPGRFILLSPGQTFSQTIYLPETQAFVGQEISEIYGNVAMGVFEAVGVSQSSSQSESASGSGPNLEGIDPDSLTPEELQELRDEIERSENSNQQAMDSASQGSLVYALDYPILTLTNSGGSTTQEQIENSGANMTDGTTTPTLSVVRRVSLDN